MSRFVCIHGHFYQPPRENPWLEAIEVQDSAYPYHDWNERVTAECYAPNAVSRILDASDRIVEIVNNYAKISFDFGPTLLSWMEEHAPDVYAAVLDADRESRARFSGHGSGLAHAYNHAILPLAGARDKRTQVLWGIADFRRRFGREPEGMWLPETAVDLESLEVLAEAGIRFTVLAPHQAAATRLAGESAWTPVLPAGFDTTRPYGLSLPSGRRMALFFYDEAVAREVAFGGLLHSGQQFAARVLSVFPAEGAEDALVHFATDGETYGHHHPHGDMALAFATRAIARHEDVRLTNYAEYLEAHPPVHEVEIRENTSWSCAHGIERWRSDCGCASGAHPGWTQAWRAPLREALSELRNGVAPHFERRAGELLTDPWKARDEYVEVVLDRSPDSVARFFARHAVRPLDAAERVAALELLELQRHAMLMFTSCGWFFDDLAGIEGLQVLQYAGRVVQLAEKHFGGGFEEGLRTSLAPARSNRPGEGNGRDVWDRHVRPARVELSAVGGHYAVRSLFEPYAPEARLYCYAVEREDLRIAEIEKLKLGIGRARFTSRITGESDRLAFGALHLSDHNVHGGVGPAPSDADYEALAGRLLHAFERADVPELLRLLDAGLGRHVVSLKGLFRDEQRRILRIVLEGTREEAEGALRRIHERHLPLLRFLADLNTPLPRVFRATAEFVINAGLRRALEREPLDGPAVEALLEEAARERIPLDAETLEYLFRGRLERFARDFAQGPDDADRYGTLLRAVALAKRFPFPIRLWSVQNAFWRALQRTPAAAVAQWAPLADLLAVRLPAESPPPRSAEGP